MHRDSALYRSTIDIDVDICTSVASRVVNILASYLEVQVQAQRDWREMGRGSEETGLG